MPELHPCPNPACFHWNPEGRAKCFACNEGLAAGEWEGEPARGAGRLGLVALVIVVVLVAGWFVAREIGIRTDKTPPELTIESPAGEVRTAATTVEVIGRVREAHPDRVEAGSSKAPIKSGEFKLAVAVEETGDVSVVAYDKAGNASAPRVLHVVVDREPPVIAHLEPADGAVLSSAGLHVTGTASEPLKSVTVGGQAGTVDGMSFAGDATIPQGRSEVEVKITDAAGNETRKSVAVTFQPMALPSGFTAAGRTPTGSEMFTAAKDQARLVLVPGGPFTMGADDGDADEQPAHPVTLSPFFIDLMPVTNAQFAAFVAETHRSPPPPPDFDATYFESQPDSPVVNVSWADARDYAEWAGRRLPTEAEWAKAARGTDMRKYPWGNQVPDGPSGLCNLEGSEDGFANTSPVGKFPKGASPYGVLDMAGNVWEWVQDWYAPSYFAASSPTDPPGPPSGTQRCLRGGAFTSVAGDVRSTNRYFRPPGDRKSNVGFRTAASVQ